MQSSAADMKGGYDMLLSGKMQIARELDEGLSTSVIQGCVWV